MTRTPAKSSSEPFLYSWPHFFKGHSFCLSMIPDLPPAFVELLFNLDPTNSNASQTNYLYTSLQIYVTIEQGYMSKQSVWSSHQARDLPDFACFNLIKLSRSKNVRQTLVDISSRLRSLQIKKSNKTSQNSAQMPCIRIERVCTGSVQDTISPPCLTRATQVFWHIIQELFHSRGSREQGAFEPLLYYVLACSILKLSSYSSYYCLSSTTFHHPKTQNALPNALSIGQVEHLELVHMLLPPNTLCQVIT